jgi:hypothetical protein
MSEAHPHLTAEHTAFLTTALAKVNLDLGAVAGKSHGAGSHPGAMVISADPVHDNLGSRLIEISSVQHLKEVAGIPDSYYKTHRGADAAVIYPPEPVTDFARAIAQARADSCALESLIDPGDMECINEATLAFVNGDSEKVIRYEPVINALRFPAQAILTVGEDITVTKDKPLIIGENSPHVIGGKVIFGTVTIEPGGQIIVLIPVNFEAAQIVSK